MWGWLGKVFSWANGVIGGDIVGFIHDLIHGVWGWLSTLFGNVGKAWHEMFNAGGWIHAALGHFGLESLATVWDIIFKRIPAILRWAWKHIQILWHFATRIALRLEHDVISLVARIALAVHNALAWVMTHVFIPLKRDILAAWHWITTHGELVFYYITHPDKLAALIFESLLALLEREAWNIGNRLGKFFLSLIIHNVRHFLNLMEDIITAVL